MARHRSFSCFVEGIFVEICTRREACDQLTSVLVICSVCSLPGGPSCPSAYRSDCYCIV
jgi:hypothetical protein